MAEGANYSLSDIASVMGRHDGFDNDNWIWILFLLIFGNAKYSENGVYWAMNMVYSDFHPLHKDDVSKYIEHAYLFLNDKDYSGKYAKEKWYAKKRA